jgi:hypothetical protein
MAKVIPLKDDEVIQKLRWLWENGVTVKPGHFKQELRAANASMVDVETIIFDNPTVVEYEWDRSRKRYKYRISGPDLDGETLEFVVAFDIKNSKLIFITAF